MDDLIPIGRFARLSGLSIGALRHYAEVGLLAPAAVDDDTGYRRYSPEQLPQARAIARLRQLELSLDEIREVLARGDVELLRDHLARLEAKIWHLQRAFHMTRALIDRKDELMTEATPLSVDHRQLGVELFNAVWTLLEKPTRTRDEDDTMLHRAHASAYHWSQAPERAPENRARAEWLCSRVYAVLGRAEPAFHHARRCLELCQEHVIGDWDLAFAYEALARAASVAGDAAESERYRARAAEAGEAVADVEDKELLFSDLATIR